MNLSHLLPIFVLVLGGMLAGLQAPTNAKLSAAVGSPVNAAFLSFLVGTLVLGAAALAMQSRPDMAAVKGLPWYIWLGGAYGAVFVAAAAWGVPRLGVAMVITLLVAGQLAMSLVIDHFGALGVPRQPVSAGRILGVLMVVGGVLLVRRF